jgi:hypothetical protein
MVGVPLTFSKKLELGHLLLGEPEDGGGSSHL